MSIVGGIHQQQGASKPNIDPPVNRKEINKKPFEEAVEIQKDIPDSSPETQSSGKPEKRIGLLSSHPARKAIDRKIQQQKESGEASADTDHV